MRSNGIVLLSSLLATAHAASYSLVDDYNTTNFFSSFDFFSAADPTNGFVSYKDAQVANSDGLAGYVNGMVYLGVDHTTSDASSGRASTRVTSSKSYTKGLFIADVVHMPVGCGVWPAFWTLGPNWPAGGEIDIIENVNSATTDAITLHTSSGCVMEKTGSLSTTVFNGGESSVDCGADGGYEGCSLRPTSTAAYGAGFNSAGGGVYAMEWTSDAISVWFFARGSSLASSVTSSSSPDTSSFGTPTAKFSGSCDIDSHFQDHQLVVNTALCGDWAGESWSTDATCSQLASTCDAYVQSNAADFTDAYWLINSIKVFQTGSSSSKRTEAAVVPKPFIA